MNSNLETKLKEINQKTLQDIQYLLLRQEEQIQQVVTTIEPEESISKDELWNLLTLILSEVEDIKEQVDEAKESANSIYRKTEDLLNEASEVADKNDDTLISLRDLESTINGYKTVFHQEAA